MPVRVDDADVPHVRRLKYWAEAIKAIQKDKRFKAATKFKKLAIPREIENGWYMESRGVKFRCLVAFVVCPTDGDPPGFRGRVDVLFDTKAI